MQKNRCIKNVFVDATQPKTEILVCAKTLNQGYLMSAIDFSIY
jgi:hypothetical protein